MFFSLKNARKIEETGFTAFLYNEKADVPEFNSVYVDVNGSHDKEYIKMSHRLYFVISGNGTFVVGSESKEVGACDVVVIPPQTHYSYRGKMKLFEVNFPATDASDAVKVE